MEGGKAKRRGKTKPRIAGNCQKDGTETPPKSENSALSERLVQLVGGLMLFSALGRCRVSSMETEAVRAGLTRKKAGGDERNCEFELAFRR